ncbi:MAG: hypothetical protein GY719_23930 [bacterium]|nr:hypothetical protein [bacterium]
MLEEAASLAEGQGEPYLSFGIHTNLAHAQAKAGRHCEATESLDRARGFCSRLDHPLAWLEIRWVAGYIQEGRGDLRAARDSFVAARIGFAEAGELCFAALLRLELAILAARQDDWGEVTVAAAEAAPILRNLSLYPETLAAVSLLSEALRAGEVSASLLREVRERVLGDPLLRLQ